MCVIPSPNEFLANGLQVTELCQTAADVFAPDAHVHGVDERPSSDRQRVDLRATDFLAIRFGYGRHPEVGPRAGIYAICSDHPDL
jgi:hypothetical protein